MVCHLLLPSPPSLDLADTLILPVQSSPPRASSILPPSTSPHITSHHLTSPLHSTSHPPFRPRRATLLAMDSFMALLTSPHLSASSPPLSGFLNPTSWCWRTERLRTRPAMICAALMVLEDRASLHAAYHECFIQLPTSILWRLRLRTSLIVVEVLWCGCWLVWC